MRRQRLLAALSTPALPAWALVCALHPRLRADWAQRLGLRVPPVQPGAIWLHASSLGEVAAASALLEVLPAPVLLTADTDTGAARARQLCVAAGVRPIDHPWTLAPLWAEARPRAVVFIESVWWPQLAALAQREGVPILRVSAKAGPASRRWGALLRWLGPAPSQIIARDADEAEALAPWGPVRVGGDLKRARPLGPNPLRWSRPFVVGACTHAGEEAALCAAAVPLGLGVLLAPRHPERFERVAAELEAAGYRWLRRTALDSPQVPAEIDVLLLNTLGELGDCTQGAYAALIGGSFDPTIGGHSPVDAQRAGVPVLAGPQRWANAAAFEAAPARVVPSLDALPQALQGLQPPVPLATDAGLATTAQAIRDALGSMAPERSPRPWAQPLTQVYAQLSRQHRRLRARRSVRLSLPVISVGSTNPRGPGKTSTVRWLVEELRRRGERPGVAVRGYRRGLRGRAVRLSPQHPGAYDLGDEGAYLAAVGLLVAASPDRVAASQALQDAGASVVVLDDGLQYQQLQRDRELVVIDARYPAARGLIPAGERRAQRIVPPCDGVIVHHGPLPPGLEIDAPLALARRTPGPWHRGDTPAEPHGPLAAFAGIGRPADFFASLPHAARVRVLGDHQPVSDALAAELIAWSRGLPMVCTAKDRMRLPPSLRDHVFWRDIHLTLDRVPESWFP